MKREDETSADRHVDSKIDLHNVLRNPIRRKILELLHEHGELSPSDLRRILKISVGTLYYHLDTLGPLINQTPQKKYTLSEMGRKIMISEGVNPVEISRTKPFYITAVENLSLAPFLNKVYLSYTIGIVSAVLLASLYVALNLLNNVRPLVLYFLPSTGSIIIDAVWSVGNLLFMVGYFIVTFAALSPHGRTKSDARSVGMLIIVSSIPTLILLLYSFLASQYNMFPFNAIPLLSVYAVLVVWQVLAYGVALNVMGLPYSKALLPPIALWYIAEVLEKLLGIEMLFS